MRNIFWILIIFIILLIIGIGTFFLFYDNEPKLDYSCNVDADCAPKKFRSGCGQTHTCANVKSPSLKMKGQECILTELVYAPTCMCINNFCEDDFSIASLNDPLVLKTEIKVNSEQESEVKISFYNENPNTIINVKPEIISCMKGGNEVQSTPSPIIMAEPANIGSGSFHNYKVRLIERGLEDGTYICTLGIRCNNDICPDWNKIDEVHYFQTADFFLKVK